MDTFAKNLSLLYPLTLEPCLSGDETDAVSPEIRLSEPDNLTCCQLLKPLAQHFHYSGITSEEAGYDCDVILIPLAPLAEHLKTLASSPLTKQLSKACHRWQQMKVDWLRLTLPRRQQHFDIEPQIWGNESAQASPALRHRAHQLTSGHCDFCHARSPHHSLIFRDGHPENQTDENLGVACPICACSRRLNRLSANDGVMVYLPELSPADISHLLRAVVIARRQGDERQRQGASRILRWLTEHRQEVEAFWGTSHPGEWGQALMQTPENQREDLLHRLRHIALIPNPDRLSRQIGPATIDPTTWRSLLVEYRRLA